MTGTFLCVVGVFIFFIFLGRKHEKDMKRQLLAKKEKEAEDKKEKQRLQNVTVIARKHRDLVNKYRGIYAKQVVASVDKHFLQLKAKERQLVYTNDYGQVIFHDFYEELYSFSEKVVGSEITFKFEQIEPLKKSYAYFKKYFRYFRLYLLHDLYPNQAIIHQLFVIERKRKREDRKVILCKSSYPCLAFSKQYRDQAEYLLKNKNSMHVFVLQFLRLCLVLQKLF